LFGLATVPDLHEQQAGTGIGAPAPTTADVEPDEAPPAPPREFPTADLLSALTLVCSSEAADSDDEDDWTLEDEQALKRSVSERLSASSSAEHLHVAALLEVDPAVRVELLDRAIALSPSDPFLVFDAVRLCARFGDTVDCPLREWEQRLIAVDGHNSESWARVAVNRYAAGEHEAALEAMRHASTAAESRDYWADQIELNERGFAAASDYAFPQRAMWAFLLLIDDELELPRYEDQSKMCMEQPELACEPFPYLPPPGKVDGGPTSSEHP
jgi:hypothetical protein